MKELDFDELDRAVNTLMGNVSQTVEPAKQDDVKVLTIAPTLVDDKPPVMPVGEVKEQQPTAPVEATPATPVASSPAVNRAPAPAMRRSGRFMDVIHPAATPKKAPTQTISRQGVTVAPLSSSPAPVEEDAPVVVESAVAETPDVAQPDAFEPQTWPDPLEFTQVDTEDTGTVEVEEVSGDIVEPAETQPEPLSSPFVPDVKVEKRPLGGPAPEFASDATMPAEELDADVVASDESTEPVAELAALPEELQNDLMAIESDATAPAPTETAVVDATPSVAIVEPKEEVSDNTTKEAESIPVSPRPAAPAPVVAPVGAVSIPQQYREEPSTGDVTNGSIYDTASYHQPFEHPVKKKTGWLWVIWVLILLVLGAGGGALAYLYLLQ